MRLQQARVGRGREAREIKRAELHLRHGDAERPQLRREDVGEGREGGADGRFGGVEWGVDGGDDGGREDEDLGARRLLVHGGAEAGGEEGEEGLDGEDRLEEVGVEEVGEARGRDGGNRGGLVVEGGDQDHCFEGEMMALAVGDGRVRGLEEAGKIVDRGASTRGL